MSIPTPEKGLVIRYAFLWSEEHEGGRDEGRKDRPCGIVVSKTDEDGGTKVIVVPITHVPPRADQHSLELTEAEKKAAGLDDERQWVILEELNRFTWPGYDLRKIPETGRYDYGRLPSGTHQRIVAEIHRLDRARKAAGAVGARVVSRD